MSKFCRNVMERAVYAPLARQKEDPSVLLGSLFGEDIALVDTGSGFLASHVDPIVGAAEGLGRLAVHVACNDLAASGVPPRWLQILVLVPSAEDTEQLRSIMEEAVEAAGQAGAVIVGGHSGYSSGLSRPLAAVTAFGKARKETLVCTSGARKGDVICLTRGMGLEGTAILAWDYPEECRRRGLSKEDVEKAKILAEDLSVVPEALRLAELGATAMHDPTRGGVLEAFLEMAWGAKACFRIQKDELPLLPVVRNFARAFDFDPLRMISSGALAVTLPLEKVAEASRAIAPWASLYPVGRVEEGGGVRICSESEEIFFSEPEPEKDELARLQILLGAPGGEQESP